MLRYGIAQFVGSWVSESGYHLRIKKVRKGRASVDNPKVGGSNPPPAFACLKKRHFPEAVLRFPQLPFRIASGPPDNLGTSPTATRRKHCPVRRRGDTHVPVWARLMNDDPFGLQRPFARDVVT